MPEFHDRFDNPLRLPVRPGRLDFRKPLLDLLLPAQGHERMMLRISSILLFVVGVVLFYRIRAFFQDLFEKHPGGIPGLVRKDRCVQLPGEITDGNKQILSSPERCLSLKQGQALRVTMQHLACFFNRASMASSIFDRRLIPYLRQQNRLFVLL